MSEYTKVAEAIPGCTYVKLRVWYIKDTNKLAGRYSIRWDEVHQGERSQPELLYRDRQSAILKALEVDEKIVLDRGKRTRSAISADVSPKRIKIMEKLESYLAEKILNLERRNLDRHEETHLHERAIRKSIYFLMELNNIVYIDEIVRSHLKKVDHFTYPKKGKSTGPRNVEKILSFLRWCIEENITVPSTLLLYKIVKPPAKGNLILTQGEEDLIRLKFEQARNPVVKVKGIGRRSEQAKVVQRWVQRMPNINATRGVDLLTRRYAMRCPEIVRLRIRDWDSQSRILTSVVFKGKSSLPPKTVKRHIDEYTAAELDLCCRNRDVNFRIFVSPRTGKPWKRASLGRLMNEIYKFFGVKPTFYRGKHSIMTKLANEFGEAGKDMAKSIAGLVDKSTAADAYFVVDDKRTRDSKMAQAYFNKIDYKIKITGVINSSYSANTDDDPECIQPS